MDENTFLVSLSMEETAKKIHSAVVDGSITGELLDHYVIQGQGTQYCIVAVYEKHYWRAGNRLTLTAPPGCTALAAAEARGCSVLTGARPPPSLPWSMSACATICYNLLGGYHAGRIDRHASAPDHLHL